MLVLILVFAFPVWIVQTEADIAQVDLIFAVDETKPIL